MAVNTTAKNGKYYQRTADGLQLIHLETDAQQVVTTADIALPSGGPVAAGTSVEDAISALSTATNSLVNDAVGTKQDKLTAGTNITLDGATISAKDTTYTLAHVSGNNAQICLNNDITKTSGSAITINDVAHATAADSATDVDLTAKGSGSDTITIQAGGGAAASFTVSNVGMSACAVNDQNGNAIDTTYATKASLKAVATSGSYNDLSDKPTIPTVNNGTLTMKVNGTQKATFTANQSGASTFNVTASDLGLSSAMKFGGVAKQSLTEGGTQNADATSGSYVIVAQPSNGTVYLDKDKHLEYVWVEGSSTVLGCWELLGQDGSYALSSVKVTGIGALYGGGTLTKDLEIGHNQISAVSNATSEEPDFGGSFTAVSGVSQDIWGHITSVTYDSITLPSYSFSAKNPTLSWGGTAEIGSAGGTTYKVTMPANPNTHYTTGMYVGASNVKSNAAVTSPYVKLYDDSAKRAEFQIKGAGGTSVSSDASGNITITSSSYDLPSATASTIGGVKLGSDTTQTVAANSVTATASRTYAVQTNSSGQAVVNVPWTDTTSAKKLDHNVSFSLTNDVTGTASSDLSGSGVSISATIGDGKVTDAKLAAPTYASTDSVYSAVAVNSKGRVTKGAQCIKYVTTEPTEAPTDLVEGGTLIYVY